MSGIKISIALGEDWQGVYIDEVLAAEGHSLSHWDWFQVIKDHFHEDAQTEVYDVNQEWLENNMGLPQKERDVRRDH